MKRIITKESIMKSIAKMVADKATVRSFLKGNTSIETVTKKGIKFAKPL
jgi:DNA-binding winged helix-turn-helix (wHTH) protein